MRWIEIAISTVVFIYQNRLAILELTMTVLCLATYSTIHKYVNDLIGPHIGDGHKYIIRIITLSLLSIVFIFFIKQVYSLVFDPIIPGRPDACHDEMLYRAHSRRGREGLTEYLVKCKDDSMPFVADARAQLKQIEVYSAIRSCIAEKACAAKTCLSENSELPVERVDALTLLATDQENAPSCRPNPVDPSRIVKENPNIDQRPHTDIQPPAEINPNASDELAAKEEEQRKSNLLSKLESEVANWNRRQTSAFAQFSPDLEHIAASDLASADSKAKQAWTTYLGAMSLIRRSKELANYEVGAPVFISIAGQVEKSDDPFGRGTYNNEKSNVPPGKRIANDPEVPLTVGDAETRIIKDIRTQVNSDGGTVVDAPTDAIFYIEIHNVALSVPEFKEQKWSSQVSFSLIIYKLGKKEIGRIEVNEVGRHDNRKREAQNDALRSALKAAQNYLDHEKF
ncbi:MAG: hypothetical protein P4M05_21140 [Bradyrhizobium sp.]|nr:hypothetical protein [Bradyrhizobium sp.]